MAARLKSLPQGTVTTGGTAVRIIDSMPDTVTKVYISAGAADVWVGDSTVAVNRGLRVLANTTASIYAQDDILDIVALYVNAAASATTFSVSYLTRT
jgi:hypothetical protein